MRKQRNGIIINVSSISGIVGFPAQSVYVNTKFALEGLSEGISYEVEQYGIKVILIEPGVINTNFVPNIKLPNLINNKSQQTLLKEQEPAIDYSNNDTKKGNVSHYSRTVDTFLSHYYLAMKNAPLPQDFWPKYLNQLKMQQILQNVYSDTP